MKNSLDIQPFRALRPNLNLASKIATLPYDVLEQDEARLIAQDNPRSFLRIIRSDIEFPSINNPYMPEIYSRAKKNLENFIQNKYLIQDARKGFYIYQMEFKGKIQRGLVALFSNQNYRDNKIKKHELTRPVKEKDRVNHILSINGQVEPVFLLYKDEGKQKGHSLTSFIKKCTEDTSPLSQIEIESGHIHSLFLIPPDDEELLLNFIKDLSTLYIADGHHRSSAASLAEIEIKQKHSPSSNSASYFLAAAFPADTSIIYPYYRVIKDLNGLSVNEFIDKLKRKNIHVSMLNAKDFITTPNIEMTKYEVCMYLEKSWYKLKWEPKNIEEKNLGDTLTVTILQNEILSPILNIQDPRTSERIFFIGGIHGEEALVNVVDRGEGKVAFSMAGVQVNDLLNIADANQIMPPKSTWFEPKLRSGLVAYLFE